MTRGESPAQTATEGDEGAPTEETSRLRRLFEYGLRTVASLLVGGFVAVLLAAAYFNAGHVQSVGSARSLAVGGLLLGVGLGLGGLWVRGWPPELEELVPLLSVGAAGGLLLIAAVVDAAHRPTVGWLASEPSNIPDYVQGLFFAGLSLSMVWLAVWQRNRHRGTSMRGPTGALATVLGLCLGIASAWLLVRAPRQVQAVQERAHYTPGGGMIVVIATLLVVAIAVRRTRS